jgi:dTDP-4-amino-4,6-dideoxygalactose transaminase
MHIAFPLFKVHMPQSVIDPLKEVLFSGFIGQGKKVEEFESLLKSYMGYEYLVTLNSCTSGLSLACKLIGIQPGDEVISSPLTCFATQTSLLNIWAKLVWADVDPETCNVSIDDLLSKISDNTKAITFVHWGGYPVDVVDLKAKILQRVGRDIPIIEDCAHCLGASINGQMVGTHGNYSAFSFQAIKHFNTIDGGILLTPVDQYKRSKLLRWYGIDREEKRCGDFRCELDVSEAGFKYHMNDVCATIGIEQMKHLPRIVQQHQENAEYYNQELANFSGVKLLKILPGARPSYWLYTVKVEDRKGFIRHLGENGIMASKVHERNDIHSCVAQFKTELPLLDSINDQIVSIPVGWWITQSGREYIVDVIKQGW